MSESTSTFETDLQNMLDQDAPTNTLIESQPGIGTVGLLLEALEKKGSSGQDIYILAGGRGAELILSRDGKIVIADDLMAVDTLIIDEASAMGDELGWLVQEIAEQRTLRGEALPNLKRVILMYPNLGEDRTPAFFRNMNSEYAAFHLTRPVPDTVGGAILDAAIENMRKRRRDRELTEHRSALTLKAGDVLDLPGIGQKVLGAIEQLDFDRYRLRLDQKFVEPVFIEVSVASGEQRTPERHVSRRDREARLNQRSDS
jgi:hypothetical protein